MATNLLCVNLGGEGEVPGVTNQQEASALDPAWFSSRDGKTLAELQAAGHTFVICPNTQLAFADNSVDEVITNNVPVDVTTFRGPGVQSSEIRRILKSGGCWVRDGHVVYTKPFLDISFGALRSVGHSDPSGESDRRFPAIVRQSPLRLFQPGHPPPTAGTRILIGVATWSMYDLYLLDVVSAGLLRVNGPGPIVEVLNTADMTRDDIARIIPGIGPVFHTPVLGIWRDGGIMETASGAAARDRVAKMFGSDSDEIVRYVHEQIASAAQLPGDNAGAVVA